MPTGRCPSAPAAECRIPAASVQGFPPGRRARRVPAAQWAEQLASPGSRARRIPAAQAAERVASRPVGGARGGDVDPTVERRGGVVSRETHLALPRVSGYGPGASRRLLLGSREAPVTPTTAPTTAATALTTRRQRHSATNPCRQRPCADRKPAAALKHVESTFPDRVRFHVKQCARRPAVLATLRPEEFR
jgi:hypothetical protein